MGLNPQWTVTNCKSKEFGDPILPNNHASAHSVYQIEHSPRPPRHFGTHIEWHYIKLHEIIWSGIWIGLLKKYVLLRASYVESGKLLILKHRIHIYIQTGFRGEVGIFSNSTIKFWTSVSWFKHWYHTSWPVFDPCLFIMVFIREH